MCSLPWAGGRAQRAHELRKRAQELKGLQTAFREASLHGVSDTPYTYGVACWPLSDFRYPRCLSCILSARLRSQLSLCGCHLWRRVPQVDRLPPNIQLSIAKPPLCRVQLMQLNHLPKPAGVAGRRVRVRGTDPWEAAGYRATSLMPSHPAVSRQDGLQARRVPLSHAHAPCALTRW